MTQGFMLLSGVLENIWIVIGALIVAGKYPDYNHKMQFLSELGVVG